MIRFFKKIIKELSLSKAQATQREKIFLFLLLLGNICTLEMFGSKTNVEMFIWGGFALLFAIRPIIALFRRSKKNIFLYASITLLSAIFVYFLYFLGLKFESYVPIMGNILSYFIILLDLIIVFVLTPMKSTKEEKLLIDIPRWLTTIILLILLTTLGINIFNNLGAKVFHQDERFSLAVSKGFSETGDFVLWDFFYNKTTTEYSRNKLFTRILTFTGEILDFNEFSMRLPGAITGLLGGILFFFLLKKLTKNNLLSIIGTFFWCFNDLVIYFSRFSRGYIFLIFIAELIILFSYLLYKGKNKNSRIILFVFILGLFILGYDFHPSIILLSPLPLLVTWYKYKDFLEQHKNFLKIFLILVSLLCVFIIYKYRLYYHLGLSLQALPQTIYFQHLLEPYNFISPPVFLYISFYLLNRDKFKLTFENIIFISLFLGLFGSIFLLNRYEDFRYVAVLQPSAIITILLIFKTVILKIHKLLPRYILPVILLLLISFMKIQIPNITNDSIFTQKAQANWENIEGDRIHRRTAVPDNKKVFTWIFDNYSKEDISIVKLQDGGISWPDDYYIKQYLEDYNYDKNFSMYVGLSLDPDILYPQTKFYEKYNTKYDSYGEDSSLTIQDILDRENHIFVIVTMAHLTSIDVITYLKENCTDISATIGTVYYVYLDSGSNRIFPQFPSVLECHKD